MRMSKRRVSLLSRTEVSYWTKSALRKESIYPTRGAAKQGCGFVLCCALLFGSPLSRAEGGVCVTQPKPNIDTVMLDRRRRRAAQQITTSVGCVYVCSEYARLLKYINPSSAPPLKLRPQLLFEMLPRGNCWECDCFC